MRLIPLAVVVTLFTIPTLAIAEMYLETGNKPQSPENYSRWHGLVDVVNQPSRQRLVWCNGAESFSYAGNTDDLNSTLQLFAQIKCPTHTVILRPGPLYDKYDWELYIVEGIVRAGIEQHKMQLVRDLDPTLVVYVSDKLQLDSLVIPPGIQVRHIDNLRSRYLKAQQVGNERTKSEAETYLKALDEDPVLKSLGKEKYQARIQRISEFIRQLPKQE
jgi:hypothetical protein